MKPLRILTWHVHGNYLYYLSHAPHQFYLPVDPNRHEGYGGRGTTFPWGDNVFDVPTDAVRSLQLDCVLFQSRKNYTDDQFRILSSAQQRLPRIYLEHDPPREHPTDTRHIVDDRNVLVVHVTSFNNLMWDCGQTPTRVIEHGVVVPDQVRYSGEIPKGLVVINNLRQRGRRLGADIFERTRREIPLDLVGMDSLSLGGLGEIPPPKLAAFAARYRFFFNPIRYTSLGLAVCEAMMIGMPIIGLATTEMVTVVENGVSGYLETCPEKLIDRMRELLCDADEARSLGRLAQRHARSRFAIGRFAHDWDQTFAMVTSRTPSMSSYSGSGRAAS